MVFKIRVPSDEVKNRELQRVPKIVDRIPRLDKAPVGRVPKVKVKKEQTLFVPFIKQFEKDRIRDVDITPIRSVELQPSGLPTLQEFQQNPQQFSGLLPQQLQELQRQAREASLSVPTALTDISNQLKLIVPAMRSEVNTVMDLLMPPGAGIGLQPDTQGEAEEDQAGEATGTDGQFTNNDKNNLIDSIVSQLFQVSGRPPSVEEVSNEFKSFTRERNLDTRLPRNYRVRILSGIAVLQATASQQGATGQGAVGQTTGQGAVGQAGDDGPEVQEEQVPGGAGLKFKKKKRESKKKKVEPKKKASSKKASEPKKREATERDLKAFGKLLRKRKLTDLQKKKLDRFKELQGAGFFGSLVDKFKQYGVPLLKKGLEMGIEFVKKDPKRALDLAKTGLELIRRKKLPKKVEEEVLPEIKEIEENLGPVIVKPKQKGGKLDIKRVKKASEPKKKKASSKKAETKKAEPKKKKASSRKAEPKKKKGGSLLGDIARGVGGVADLFGGEVETKKACKRN